MTGENRTEELSGHSGELAVAVARAHGVETMFTLSGAHVFPMYDGAVKADPPMRLLDVRHEQTAAFAAEATGKLTRVPGLAVLTAGPGVTNGVSAIAQAQFAGSPMVVVGGRAPADRWGSGSLQELDQPPIVESVSKLARTLHTAGDVLAGVDEAFTAAGTSHRGPVFVDVPMDEFFNAASGPAPTAHTGRRVEPDSDAIAQIAGLLAGRVAAGADPRHRRVGRPRRGGGPAVRRGRRASRRSPTAWAAASSPAATRCWSPRRAARRSGPADLVVVVGTPLDFRLGYGVFGGKRLGAGRPRAGRARRRLPRPGLGARQARGLGVRRPRAVSSTGCSRPWSAAPGRTGRAWVTELQDVVRATRGQDAELLGAEADPIHPARIYGELVPRLADDAVVIGDGGDFVSFAGKYVEPKRPGGWLDPGPYGCLGAGLGGAIAARLARPLARSCCCSATARPASR